jgi:hypothetical protein
MGSHINKDGKFQSDKYPTCPPGKVPLSVADPMAQDLLFEYAHRRSAVDAEFSEDLKVALGKEGFEPGTTHRMVTREDLEWMLATLDNANALISDEGLDDDEECEEINERLGDIAKRYGLEFESEDD